MPLPLKDLVNAPASSIHSHAKTCGCLIQLPIFPLRINNIIAALIDTQKQQIGNGNSISGPAMFAAPPDLTTISQYVRARIPTWARVKTEHDQRPLHVQGSAFW